MKYKNTDMHAMCTCSEMFYIIWTYATVTRVKKNCFEVNELFGPLEQYGPLEQAEIYYRKLNNVNMDSFNEDLKVLDLNDDYDLSVLIDKYENTLKETLQQHAPQKRRIITLRPLSPWYNEEIGQEKRNRRKLERRWRASGLCIDRQLYVKQCETVNAMIKNAKTTYYSSVISSMHIIRKCYLVRLINYSIESQKSAIQLRHQRLNS